MKVYKVYEVEYREPHADYTQLGYYSTLDLAKQIAEHCAKKENLKKIVIQRNKETYDYEGNKTSYPYFGIVIEEIIVKENSII